MTPEESYRARYSQLQPRGGQAVVPDADTLGAPRPFHLSPIWNWQRIFFERQGLGAWSKSLVPDYITSNSFIAHAYAHIALGYLRDLAGDRERLLDPTEPLYILELGAGSGRFAYHFLHHFFQALDSTGLKALPVCYVMSDVSRSTVAFWQSHPKLIPYCRQKRLDFAFFDVERDEHLDLILSERRISPGRLRTLLVIANYVLDGLRQDLFFVEKASVNEGWVSLEEPDGQSVQQPPAPSSDHPFKNIRLRYWSGPKTDAPYADETWNDLVRRYSKTTRSGAVLFPSHALNVLARLRRFTDAGMLFLSADRGSHLLESAHSAEPNFAFHSSFSLPVNYHAIAAILSEQRVQTWHGATAEKGLASFAAVFGKISQWPETELELRLRLTDFSADNFYSIRNSLRGRERDFTLDEIQAYFKFSQCDAKLFHIFRQELHRQLPHASHSIRQQWSKILSSVWERHLPIPDEQDLAFDLATLAGKMHCWSQAANLYQLSLQFKGSHRATHYNLGIAFLHLGRHDEAESHLAKSVIAFPNDSNSRLLLEVREWKKNVAARISTLDAVHVQAGNSVVRLVPLGVHHARALFFHQPVAAASESARLPHLASVVDARKWIEAELSRPERMLQVIVHCDHGPIGLAGLHGTGNPALCCHWVGQDFQHLDYGTQALMLLRSMAAREGITAVEDAQSARQS